MYWSHGDFVSRSQFLSNSHLNFSIIIQVTILNSIYWINFFDSYRSVHILNKIRWDTHTRSQNICIIHYWVKLESKSPLRLVKWFDELSWSLTILWKWRYLYSLMIVFHMKCIQNLLKFILVLDPIFIIIFRVWLVSILVLSENVLVTSVSVTYVNEDDWWHFTRK